MDWTAKEARDRSVASQWTAISVAIQLAIGEGQDCCKMDFLFPENRKKLESSGYEITWPSFPNAATYIIIKWRNAKEETTEDQEKESPKEGNSGN